MNLNIDFSYVLKISMIFYAGVVIFFTIPFFVYQYRKYGTSNIWRTVTIYSMVFYLLTALFTVILPLPTREAVDEMTGPEMQLDLFRFLDEFRNQGLLTGGFDAWRAFIQTKSFQQVFFNVVLTIPFGVYLKYYFKQNIVVVMILSFVLSLSFELLQLSALFGFYSRPYRLFDVDDLMLNTLGGVIGALITPLLALLLPPREEMDGSQAGSVSFVTIPRRLISNAIDFILLGILAFGFVYIVYDAPEFIAYILHPKELAKVFVAKPELFAVLMVLGIIYFTVIPWLTKGFTLGKKLVQIKLTGTHGDQIGFGWLLLRYAFIGGIFFVLYACFAQLITLRHISVDYLNGIMISLFVLMFLGLALLIDFIYAVSNRKPFVYERISGIANQMEHL